MSGRQTPLRSALSGHQGGRDRPCNGDYRQPLPETGVEGRSCRAEANPTLEHQLIEQLRGLANLARG